MTAIRPASSMLLGLDLARCGLSLDIGRLACLEFRHGLAIPALVGFLRSKQS